MRSVMLLCCCDSDLWLCQHSRPVCPVGPDCWPTSWPGSGSRRRGGGSSGTCMLSTSDSKAFTARDRLPGALVTPTSRGNLSAARLHISEIPEAFKELWSQDTWKKNTMHFYNIIWYLYDTVRTAFNEMALWVIMSCTDLWMYIEQWITIIKSLKRNPKFLSR